MYLVPWMVGIWQFVMMRHDCVMLGVFWLALEAAVWDQPAEYVEPCNSLCKRPTKALIQVPDDDDDDDERVGVL